MKYWTARELQRRQDLNAALVFVGRLTDIDQEAMRDLKRQARREDADERLAQCGEWT